MDKIGKVIWAESGIKSLENLMSYISIDSEYYASNFTKNVLKIVDNLEYFPKLGRIVPEYRRKDLRELIYQNYRIVYLIQKSIIHIVYIGHSAKRLPAENDLV